MISKGKFITFEGIDGSGKSTQLSRLSAVLKARGIDHVTTREPGGTPLGRRLREAFLESEENVAPMAELLAFAADRAQHVEHLIKPSIASGRVVISDRYADATFAYQGAGRGFSTDQVNAVIELATGGLKPDVTLFFDISVAIAIRRMAERNNDTSNHNRMDRETTEFYERVRDAYLGIALREPQRFIVINGEASIAEIHTEVVSHIEKVI